MTATVEKAFPPSPPRRRVNSGRRLVCPVAGRPVSGEVCLHCEHSMGEGTGGVVGCELEERAGAFWHRGNGGEEP